MTKEQKGSDLRQALNEVTLEGTLVEIKTNEGQTTDGREYLGADLTIETGESEQHVVKMFSMRLNKTGAESGIYKSLRTVVDEYKTVQDVGREEAEKVRVAAGNANFANGQLQVNDHYGESGARVYTQIGATFVNRLDSGEELNPFAKFQTELVVGGVLPEFDADQEETGRVILKGYIPVYGGKVIPFSFVVHEDGADYVLDKYSNGDTVLVYGDIINKTEKVVVKTEAAFGEDKEDVKYNYTREFVVRGGTEAFDEDDAKAYDVDLIKSALKEREIHLEKLKSDFENKGKNEGKKTGFDTSAPAKNRSVEKDPLPF